MDAASAKYQGIFLRALSFIVCFTKSTSNSNEIIANITIDIKLQHNADNLLIDTEKLNGKNSQLNPLK